MPTAKMIKAPIMPFLNQVLALVILASVPPAFRYITPETTIAITAKIIPAAIRKLAKGIRIFSTMSFAVNPWPGGRGGRRGADHRHAIQFV